MILVHVVLVTEFSIPGQAKAISSRCVFFFGIDLWASVRSQNQSWKGLGASLGHLATILKRTMLQPYLYILELISGNFGTHLRMKVNHKLGRVLRTFELFMLKEW